MVQEIATEPCVERAVGMGKREPMTECEKLSIFGSCWEN